MTEHAVRFAQALARAYGYPPRAVELVGEWLGRRPTPLRSSVTPTRIEVEVLEGVRLCIPHPAPFDIVCPDFMPAAPDAPVASARGCTEYAPGGRCRLRPGDMCIEFERALRRRS